MGFDGNSHKNCCLKQRLLQNLALTDYCSYEDTIIKGKDSNACPFPSILHIILLKQVLSNVIEALKTIGNNGSLESAQKSLPADQIASTVAVLWQQNIAVYPQSA